MIPAIVKPILTTAGMIALEACIDKVAEKMSTEAQLPKERIKDKLSVGFIVKGLPNIYYDIKTLKGQLPKNRTLDDVKIVVVKDKDGKDTRTYKRMSADAIRGQFNLNPSIFVPDVQAFLLSAVNAVAGKKEPKQVEQVDATSIPKDIYNQNQEPVEPFTVIEGGQMTKLNQPPDTYFEGDFTEVIESDTPIETVISEKVEPEPLTETTTEPVATLESLGMDELSMVEDTGQTDETNPARKGYGESSGIGKMVDGTKNGLAKMSNKLSEFKDVLDTFKGTEKVQILIEECDMSRSFSMQAEGEFSPRLNQGYNRQPSGYNQPNQPQYDLQGRPINKPPNQTYKNQNYPSTTNSQQPQLLEVVHIYKDSKYLTSVSRYDFLDFFKLIATGGEIMIKDVEYIKTIKDEFEPKERWRY